jgi:site-specific recombinase XerD
MKQETINQKCAQEVLGLLRKYNRNPSQVRYIFKRVRELGKYQVPNKPRKLPDYLNDTEIGAVLDLSLKMDSTTSLLIPLGIFTGLRINEITNLQVQHIDLNSYQIKVVQGKGSKDRIVPINYELASKIKYYIGDRKTGYLFVKSNHTQFSKRGLQKKIEKVFNTISLAKKLSAHSLRHTYATLLLRRGMSLDRIQLLMGHSKRSTTEIYAHLELEPVKQEYFKLMGF